MRRVLIGVVLALALAVPAPVAADHGPPVVPFTHTSGTLRMDDGVPLAYDVYVPAGAMPAGGWPGVLVLHGLGGSRASVAQISSYFAGNGYAVLAYDARGHGASGGEVTLAGPREVADLRAIRDAFAARADVSDRAIGAWGISYGGGQIWNALAAGVPLAAAEVVETWTSLYEALWSGGVARSALVAGFAASVAPRSPLIAGIRDAAVQSRNMATIRELTAERSALPRLGSVTTPVYMLQGRIDYAFDISQASAAFARLAGPKRLYVGEFGHLPSAFPGPDVDYVLQSGRLWFDVHVKRQTEPPSTGVPMPIAFPAVTIARGGARRDYAGLPPTRTETFALRGTSTARGQGFLTRRTKPLARALETWGGGTVTLNVPRLTRYPRLVVTVTAPGVSTVVTHGAVVPRRGRNVVRLANYAVSVPRGARLTVHVGAASPQGHLAYLGFGDAGSVTVGAMTLRLSGLR